MMKKVLNWIMIGVFAAMLIVPLATSDFLGGKVSADENRYLAQAPSLFDINGTPNSLETVKSQAEDWINDNIGGRLKAYNMMRCLNYQLGEIREGNKLFGKDGWIFSLGDSEIPIWQNRLDYSDSYMDNLKEKFIALGNSFGTQGIRLYFANWPWKFQVYPEYMPDTLFQLGTDSMISRTNELWTDCSALKFYNPLDMLIAEKENALTYSKAKDTSHWSNYGAFKAYQGLMNLIRQDYPNLKILTEDDFDITHELFKTQLPDGSYSEEYDYVYKLRENHATANHQYFEENGIALTDIWKSWRYYRNEDTTLPKLLMIGDSYVWMFMVENMAQSFSEVAFVHYYDLDKLDKLIELLSPDAVLMAARDTGLSAFANCTLSDAAQMDSLEIQSTDMFFQCVDTINDQPYQGAALTVDNNLATQHLSGWAVDPVSQKPAKSVMAKVGDQTYTAIYGREMPSVSAYFENEELRQSGYDLYLKTSAFEKTGVIELYVEAADGACYYGPITIAYENEADNVQVNVDKDNEPNEAAAATYLTWTETPYHFLDFANDRSCENSSVIVNPKAEETKLVGWAVDALSATSAYGVEIHIGDKMIFAPCEEERSAVAEAFGSEKCLKSGYACYVANDLLVHATEVTFVVIAADGVSAYQPVTLPIELLDE